jgi:hypothetical protein
MDLVIGHRLCSVEFSKMPNVCEREFVELDVHKAVFHAHVRIVLDILLATVRWHSSLNFIQLNADMVAGMVHVTKGKKNTSCHSS